MKKVTELKDGMKVWIPYQVIKSSQDLRYPFTLKNVGHGFTCTKNGEVFLGLDLLEMYEQEEFPTLTPVEMEVSDNGRNWVKKDVFGKIHDVYVTEIWACFNFVRPIQKKVTLEIPEELLTDELRKYLK